MTTHMHPPADRRCQVYGETTVRCINDGTRWIRWGGGCACVDPGDDVCEQDIFSWECDGPHLYGEAA